MVEVTQMLLQWQLLGLDLFIFIPLADGDAMMLTPTCSANTAELKFAFIGSDNLNIRVHIDYICNENNNIILNAQQKDISNE